VTRRLLPTLLVAVGLFALPACAMAKINVAVGIGDQSAKMFSDPHWQALKLKKARYFIEWNAIDQPADLANADAYMSAAKKAGVKVLLHISTDDINSVPRRALPSVDAYKSKVGALIRRYRPQGVVDWGVWNEANHKSQPTSTNPKRAAQFYKVFKGMCSGCNVVALDVLDQAGVAKYIASWFKAAGSSGKTAKIFGIHNYSQVNRRITAKKASDRYPGTQRIIDAVRKHNTKAKFWYTETGGLAKFGSAFPCNKSRQANRTSFMFDMIKTYDKDVTRLYSYNWYGDNCVSFDAGLVEANGALRPAYSVFKSKLKNVER
jgi:hypothetical protein